MFFKSIFLTTSENNLFWPFWEKKYQRKFKDVHKKRNSGFYWKNVIYAQIKYTYCYQLINIIFSLPVNTGWFEQEYSTLEIICQLPVVLKASS